MEEKKYTLSELYRNGVLSASVMKYREINDKVRQLVRSKVKHGKSVRIVADELGVTVQTVYASLRVKI